VDGVIEMTGAGAPVDWRRLALPAACFTAGTVGAAVAVMLFSEANLVALVLVICWLAYPVVGAVVLDTRPGSGLGELLGLLGTAPLMIAVYAALGAGREPTAQASITAIRALAGPLSAALLVGMPLLAVPAVARPRPIVLLAGAGAALSLSGGLVSGDRLSGLASAWVTAGWLCVGAAVVGVLVLLLRAALTTPRKVSRPAGWLTTLLLAAIASVAGLAAADPTWPRAYLLAAALLALPVAMATIHLAEEFPPPGEVWLDAMLALTWVGTLALSLVGVRAWADAVELPDPASAGTVAAALLGIGLLPVLLSIRRSVLIRRYGLARVPTRMLSELTSRLSDSGDPRSLLDIAARAAADAVRSPSASITLGPDQPEPPPGAAVLPLLLGGERIGNLVIEPRRAGQPLERRDLAVLDQLAVPVALVARAVAVAVEVEHARQDERRRILADLHDGLGPVLAGLSMQVAGARRMVDSDPRAAAALDAAGAGLAESRAEVRRMVAGMTPSPLVDGDLPRAVNDLVRGLRPLHGPSVHLRIDAALAGVDSALATAAYRTVAEALTNALRHADAQACTVDVRDAGDHILVQVSDDGLGIPANRPAGVGLGSLRDRAKGLGGRLDIESRPGGGTTLRARLPKGTQ
jgi:signal transduction histidine kinase